uniref:Lon N-terminal domain-containing protein n=1 Tax=Amphimedon queenslandica TaxID=400682 RepID=A0A1X7U1M0_AMPQE
MYTNEADVITNLDDIYNIGTFVQITEFQEFNNRMRLIIQGHRLVRHGVRHFLVHTYMYIESLAQIIEAGKRVIDDPTHLADFGAALTSGESHQIQAVLECPDIPERLILALELPKKELAIVTLQKKLGKEVEEKFAKMQRKYNFITRGTENNKERTRNISNGV